MSKPLSCEHNYFHVLWKSYYKCLRDWQIAEVTRYSPNQRSCYTLPLAMGGRRCRCCLHDKTLVHIP